MKLSIFKAGDRSIAKSKGLNLVGNSLKRLQGCIKKDEVEGILKEWTPEYRDELMNQGHDGILRGMLNCFSAPRKKVECGRLVVDFRIINGDCKDVVVPMTTLQNTHEPILQTINGLPMKYFTELDMAKAFAGFKLDPELSTSMAIVTGSGIYVPVRGMLGLKVMPGLFDQFIYPSFLRLMTTKEIVKEFTKEILEAIKLDEENGVKQNVYA